MREGGGEVKGELEGRGREVRGARWDVPCIMLDYQDIVKHAELLCNALRLQYLRVAIADDENLTTGKKLSSGGLRGAEQGTFPFGKLPRGTLASFVRTKVGSGLGKG